MASQNIRAITKAKWSDPTILSQAITDPWISLDSNRFRNALIWDVDHADVLDRLDRLPRGCPKPHVTICPWSGRAHAFLMLKTPILMTDEGRQASKDLGDWAGKLMAEGLGGTLLPFKSLTKSPWGQVRYLQGQRLKRGPQPENPDMWNHYEQEDSGLMWQTVPGDMAPVELKAIVKALEPWYGSDIPRVKFAFKKKRKEYPINGRNDEVFHTVRVWCYDNKAFHFDQIYGQVDSINGNLSNPLPMSEVLSISKSIHRWMNTEYRPRSISRVNRGRDNKINEGLTTKEKQAIAGKISAHQRQAISLNKIYDAIDVMRSKSLDLTQKTVSQESGLSIATVKRLWNNEKVSHGALSGSGSASQLSKIFSKTIKQISLEDRFGRKEEVFYKKLISKLEKRGSKPLKMIREPIGFSRNNPEHVHIFELFNKAFSLNEHALRKSISRQKASESKARKVEREAWHADNSRYPAEETKRLFDIRIKGIKADCQERIEAVEEDEPYGAELIKMGMISILAAERRARAQARENFRNLRNPIPERLPAVFIDLEELED